MRQLCIWATGMLLSIAPTTTLASFYGGGGVGQGLDHTKDIIPGTANNPRQLIIDILFGVLSFLALAAVIVIIIAGIILVVAGVSDTARDRARKIVLYAIVGLLIIILASAIVGFFTTIVA